MIFRQLFEPISSTYTYLLAGLKLPYPKFIDYAVPGNKRRGVCPDDLPEHVREYCGRMAESPQG